MQLAPNSLTGYIESWHKQIEKSVPRAGIVLYKTINCDLNMGNYSAVSGFIIFDLICYQIAAKYNPLCHITKAASFLWNLKTGLTDFEGEFYIWFHLDW